MRFWLIQDAEPLPVIDKGARLMRTAIIAQMLSERGHSVDWFTGRFDHTAKSNRDLISDYVCISPNYNIYLLDGSGYKSNVSLARIKHHRVVAESFKQSASKFKLPDVIVASYPSPELCKAAYEFADFHRIPFVIDVRDTWPDTFYYYVPFLVRPFVSLVIRYYRKLIHSAFNGAKIRIAVSPGMLRYAQIIGKVEKYRQLSDKVFYLGYPDPGIILQELDIGFTTENPLECIFIGSAGMSYELSIIQETAQLLHNLGERRVHFTIIGNHKMQHKNLSNLTYTGWLGEDQIASYATKAHLGLCFLKAGSLHMGDWVGNKVFEYMSFGIAVALNCKSGDLFEVFNDSGAGFTNICNASELKTLLESFLSNPEILYKSMKTARELFQNNYTSEQIYYNYCNVLEKIASASK